MDIGELIGEIRLLQRMRRREIAEKSSLLVLSRPELEALLRKLESGMPKT